MDISIRPSKLSGNITAVPSQAEAHIKLICAALSNGTVHNVPFTQEVCCTLDALKELGSEYDFVGDSIVFRGFIPNPNPTFCCGESTKVLVYFMCLCCACRVDMNATFTGSDKLPRELISAIADVLKEHGVTCDYNGELPFTVKGSLGSGEFTVPAKYADEIVSGLLVALNRNNTDSFIAVLGSDYSKSDIELTVDILRESKIMSACADDIYIVRGDQNYRLYDTYIGGDFSLASNFVVANFINSNVRVSGLDAMSAQSEKVIFDILRRIQSSGNKSFDLDCSELSNLVPILAVYACSLKGISYLKNVKGNGVGETVNVELICQMINSVGESAKALDGGIEIVGLKELKGGVIDCCFEHRVVYAAAILSTLCTDTVIIKNAECVTKPYASFFDDFRRVGGNAEIIVN